MTLRVLLCPPRFFAQRREWISFGLNSCLYGFGLIGLAASLNGLAACDEGAGWLLLVPALFWLFCLAHVADASRRERARARASAGPPRRRPVWKKMARLAVFLVSFAMILNLLQVLVTRTGRTVGPEGSPLLPVLVVTPGPTDDMDKAHLVFHKDLGAFRESHPDYTYLVRHGTEGRLKSQLSGGDFTVAPRANGRQAFEVWKTVHSEAYAIGWYEASEKELFPRRFSLFHEMMTAMFMFPAVVGSLLVAWIAGKLLDRIRKVQPA
jgi:hypothetical protein